MTLCPICKRSNKNSMRRSRPRPTKPRSKRSGSPRSAAKGRCRSCSRRSARMTPDERREQGPQINGLKDRVTAALRVAQGCARRAGARCSAQHRDRRRNAAVARTAGRKRAYSSDQPGHRRTHGDFRRHGLFDRRGAGYRNRRSQLHQAEFSGSASGARHARHVLLQPEARRLPAAAAHPHVTGPDPDHANVRSRRSASSFRAAPIAAIPIRPTPRCSIRSRAW